MEHISFNKFTPKLAMDTSITQQLTELFKETGHMHHRAFLDSDGYDPEWPLWYAEYMHEKVMDIIDAELTRSELVYLLVAADLDHRDEAPGEEWTTFYGEFLMESVG